MVFLLVRFNIYQEIGYVKYKIAYGKRVPGEIAFTLMGR